MQFLIANLIVDYPIDTTLIVTNDDIESIHLAGNIYDFSKKYADNGQIGVILNKVNKENYDKTIEQVTSDELEILGILDNYKDGNVEESIKTKIEDIYVRLNLPQEGGF